MRAFVLCLVCALAVALPADKTDVEMMPTVTVKSGVSGLYVVLAPLPLAQVLRSEVCLCVCVCFSALCVGCGGGDVWVFALFVCLSRNKHEHNKVFAACTTRFAELCLRGM